MTSQTHSILMIDDDEEFCAMIMAYLEKRFFRVQCRYTGEAGIQAFKDQPDVDLILLDMLLPDISGQEVLRELRALSPRVPIVMLSALNEEIDRILTLELGADDYIPKVFSSRELLARIRSVLRRNELPEDGSSTPPQTLAIRGLTLNVLRKEAYLNEEPLNLTACEFILLSMLMEQPGRICSREELLAAISDREFSPLDRSVDMHISSLRHKLRDNSRFPIYIKTLRSSGYVFIQ